MKPLGIKNYGHIPHLPGSRMTPKDHKCHDGQKRIACEKTRDKHDYIYVEEKLDGSNVGVCLKDGILYPMTRAGYVANTSKYRQHIKFFEYVHSNEDRFRQVISEGERIVGEWLYQAHGTRYRLKHEPFVAFDIFDQYNKRYNKATVIMKINWLFAQPHLLYSGTDSCSIEKALSLLGDYGHHGALDKTEGCIWRVERKGVVDFLVKYVRPEKQDGIYLSEYSKRDEVLNEISC